MKNPKIIFEWQRSASEGSRKGWEARWERAMETGAKVGPKGEAYLEQKYGPVVGGGGSGGGRYTGGYRLYDDFDDYDDFDFEDVEY